MTLCKWNSYTLGKPTPFIFPLVYYHLSAPTNFPALKKEKAALLKEQERLNGERKALKETMQGMSEAYRAIDDQMRQMQRSRAPKRSRDDNDLS